MNVLRASPRTVPLLGGQEIHVEQLTTALVDRGVGHRILFAHGSGSASEKVRRHRLRTPRLRGNILSDLFFGARLARFSPAGDVDIVHTHGDAPIAWGGSLAARRARAVHVHSFHSGMMRDPVRRSVLRALLPKRSFYLAVSRTVAEDLVACGVSRDRIHVRPSGVRSAFFIPGDEPRKAAVAVGGRLTPLRRVLELAEAWIRAGIHDVPLMVFGSGPEEGPLKRLADEHDAITWLGKLDELDLAALLRDVSAGIVMRRRALRTESSEGTPTLGLEMLAAGCFPIVSRTTGELPSLVADTGFGVVVDDLPDPARVAELARDYAEPRSEERESVRQRIHTDYSWAAAAEDVESFYRRALSIAGAI